LAYEKKLVIFFAVLFNGSYTSTNHCKCNGYQPPKFVVNANLLFTETAQKIILGDSITIAGGSKPYQYSWFSDGNLIGNTLTLEIPRSTPHSSIIFTVKDSNNCSYTKNASFVNINEIKEDTSNISVYPNPTTDFIVINTKGIDEKLDVSIYDSQGVFLFKKQIAGTRFYPFISNNLNN